MSGQRLVDQGIGEGEYSNIDDIMYALSSQGVDSRLDPGLDEHKWHLSAIRALLYYLVVGQVLLRFYRIPDIKVAPVVWKQNTS